MDWVKILTPTITDTSIPVIPASNTHSYVHKSDLPKIAALIGRTPRIGSYNYEKFEGVKIDTTLPVMLFIHLGKEIVDLFGLKKIYFKKSLGTADANINDVLDARNLFIVIHDVPDNAQHSINGMPSILRFGDITISVPDAVRDTYLTLTSHCKAHKILDDRGTIVAFARDNKIWIPFDIAKMENDGSQLNWLPTSLTRLILQRAIPKSLTEDIAPVPDSVRIEHLKKSEKEWLKAWKQDSKERIAQLRSKLLGNEEQYRSLCNQLATCVKEREEHSRSLMLEQSCDTDDSSAMTEFNRMLTDIPELTSIELNGSQLKFKTSMIYLEEDVSRNPHIFEPFPLGEYEIICQPGSVPKIVNRTRTLTYEGYTWHHPHAKTDRICYGNISARISEYSSMRKWHDVVTLVVQFLKNCNAKEDEWGRLGFKRWQDAGKIASENVINKEQIAPKAIEWAKYVPKLRKYTIKPDDAVLAICPASCPLYDKNDTDGKPVCLIQGTGKREGVVKGMLDEFVNVEWQVKLNDTEEEAKVDCVGFTYDSILRLDGKPLYEGHIPPALYPEREAQAEIISGMEQVLGTIDPLMAKKLATIAQEDESNMRSSFKSTGLELTMEEIDAIVEQVTDNA